ncbi:MAG: isoprenylcysteine carboxylmethyltransferase family protein [Candidatus Thorarchaeota archaeon]|nr:MAG: isoprenylcysteine carboxylmethyltransferase family protein [Candidatus Thorarchaeota archaeon]
MAGPTVGFLALVDVLLHLNMDLRKHSVRRVQREIDTGVRVPGNALAAASIATLLSFGLVLMIVLDWVLVEIQILSTYSWDWLYSFTPLWVIGLVLLSTGIFLHMWSRYVRKEMAASWSMSEEHKIVTIGPYSKVRHPSYTSYLLSFIGLIMMIPSPLSLCLIIGIPGYYVIAKKEELHLIEHFGEEYRTYINNTGMFFPRFKSRRG